MNAPTIIYILLFLLVSQQITAQDVSPEPILSAESSYIADGIYNVRGGLHTGAAVLGLGNLRLTVNLENADIMNNTTCFINAAHSFGNLPSATLTGQLQTISNIEAGNLTYFQELWIKKKSGKMTFIAGLQDLCAEFVSAKNTSFYMNGSFGIHPNITMNFPAPVFPLSSLGLQIQLEVNSQSSFKAALFDGLPDGFDSNPYNLKWRLKKSEGYQFFAEYSLNKPGFHSEVNIKTGFTFHNSYIKTRVDSIVNDPVNLPADYGAYLLAERTLIYFSSQKHLDGFIQTGVCPRKINDNWYYFGGGINYSGFSNKHPDNIIGIAFAHAGLSSLNHNETVIEGFCRIQVNDKFYLNPDIQFIIHPGGTGQNLKNALACLIRTGFNF
jgi:porin